VRSSISYVMCTSAHLYVGYLAPTERILMMDLSIFLKSVEKVKGSLKSDKNNGYFNWRPFFRM